MMDETLKAILSMLSAPEAKKRSASAIVIAHLKPEDAEVMTALGEASGRADDPHLRRAVVEAIGEIAPQTIVSDLTSLVKDPDRHVRMAVRRVLSTCPNVRISDVEDLLDTTDERQRLAAVAVLGAIGTSDARDRLLKHLRGASMKVSGAIVDALRPILADEGPEEKMQSLDALRQIVTPDASVEDPAFTMAGIQLLGYTEDPIAAETLERVTAGGGAESVRIAALETIQRLVRGRGHEALFEKLVDLVEDKDVSDGIRRACLNVLGNLSVPMEHEERVRRLALSENTNERRWAIKALGLLDGVKAADTLADVVETGAADDRELALESALKTSSGQAAMARLLSRLTDERRANQVAAGLRSCGDALTSDATHALEQAVMVAPPQVGKLLLGVLKVGGGDADRVHHSLLDRAIVLKNKNRYEEAATMLRSLIEGGDEDPEVGYQLGICELKKSKRKITRSTPNEMCVKTLTALLRHKEFPLLDRLTDERVLDPEDLYYLGFACSERNGPDEGLGGDVLMALTEQSPATKYSEMAHNKLVTMGWAE